MKGRELYNQNGIRIEESPRSPEDHIAYIGNGEDPYMIVFPRGTLTEAARGNSQRAMEIVDAIDPAGVTSIGLANLQFRDFHAALKATHQKLEKEFEGS